MNKVDNEILNINKVISNNIDRFDDSERGLLSQNILSQLRNFVDHISLKAYSNGKDIDNTEGCLAAGLGLRNKRKINTLTTRVF